MSPKEILTAHKPTMMLLPDGGIIGPGPLLDAYNTPQHLWTGQQQKLVADFQWWRVKTLNTIRKIHDHR